MRTLPGSMKTRCDLVLDLDPHLVGQGDVFQLQGEGLHRPRRQQEQFQLLVGMGPERFFFDGVEVVIQEKTGCTVADLFIEGARD